MKIKLRKMYEVRYTPPGCRFGRHVGYKHRLLSHVVASRIAKRLCGAGVDSYIAPLQINMTFKAQS